MVLLVVLLSSCDDKSTNLNSEKIPKDEINMVIDRLNNPYKVRELSVPNELVPKDDYVLQQGTFDKDIAYFQMLDKKASNLYPTKALYLYHISTQEIEEIKSYKDNKEIRVIDFRMLDSSLYEMQLTQQGDLFQCNVMKNGKVLQTSYLSDPLQATNFTNINGKLQYLISSIENNTRSLHLYEINNDKINDLYSEEINFQLGRNNYGKKLDVGTIFQNQNSLLSFAVNDTAQNSEEILNIYDGERVSKTSLEERVFRMIPLEKGIFLITYEMSGLDQKFKYYWYNKDSEEISELKGEIQNIERPTKVSDHSFLFSNEQKQTCVGVVENGEFKSRTLEGIPVGISCYGNVSSSQDFVMLDIVHNEEKFWDEIKFFIIDWS